MMKNTSIICEYKDNRYLCHNQEKKSNVSQMLQLRTYILLDILIATIVCYLEEIYYTHCKAYKLSVFFQADEYKNSWSFHTCRHVIVVTVFN